MTGRRVRGGPALAAWVIVAASCHHGAPADAPLPTLPAEPPPVQAPVGSGPTLDVGGPAAPNAPDPQLRRFDVVAAEDTTFTILIGGDRWVRRGTVGVAVDPKRRDALVARFRVISRVGDSAIALITGQTTRLSSTDVALIREPVPGPLRQDAFWAGLFFGIAAGIAGVLVVRR